MTEQLEYEEFRIPFMVVTRADIGTMLKNQKYANKLTGKQVQKIADAMGNYMTEDFNFQLQALIDNRPELFKVEE